MNLENDSEKPDFSPFLFFVKKAHPLKRILSAFYAIEAKMDITSTRVEIASKNGLKMRRDTLLVFCDTLLFCVFTNCSSLIYYAWLHR